jgi:hypothetical protein
MNVQKLFKAASMIARANPNLSEELTKIAQELSETVTDTITPQTPGASAVPSTNPNIKNFANPSTQSDQKKTHKITFTVAVPPSWGELEIMNKLLPVLKQMDATEKDLEIKGYQFSQS